MRVAILNHCDYILRMHREKYATEAGVTQGQIDALVDWQRSSMFNGRERALLGYVGAMTRDIDVTDHVFFAIDKSFE